MSNANKTIKVFIPFLKATMQILQEVTQEVFIKKNVYTHVGNLTGADYQVEIGIIGDIRSRVIFSFPKPFAECLASIMLGIADDEVDDETLEGTIQEIGNMVSGNALGLLEEIGINSDITPPKLFPPGSVRVVGDQAQLGVLEFSSNMGNFQVAIVTSENNKVLKNDVIITLGLEEEASEIFARFFYTKGIYLIGCSSQNFIQRVKQYNPTIVIYNTDFDDQNLVTQVNSIENAENIHLITFGNNTVEHSYKTLHQEDSDTDPYTMLETIKNILDEIGISIYDNRKNIVLEVPRSRQDAHFLVKTRRGDVESIPIIELSFSYITIDITAHQYINFPERKNLVQKNEPSLQLGNEEIVRIEKSQIGKMIDDNTIVININHILETEISKITNYIYKTISH